MPSSPYRNAWRFALAAFALMAVQRCTAVAQEFRVETEIFVGDEEKPRSRTVTLFGESAVYDFVDEPEEVVVYRRGAGASKGQFILLNPGSKQRTDVDVARMESLISKIKRWAGDQEDQLMRFCAEPDFNESFDVESGELLLSHDLWTYRVATVDVDKQGVVARFREFADNYAQLNTMLHGTPPPGPRLELNKALVLHNVAPVEIRRTISGDEKHEVRASHLFSWRLSRDDRARLDRVREDLANFKKVDNKTFLAARLIGDKQQVRGQSE